MCRHLDKYCALHSYQSNWCIVVLVKSIYLGRGGGGGLLLQISELTTSCFSIFSCCFLFTSFLHLGILCSHNSTSYPTYPVTKTFVMRSKGGGRASRERERKNIKFFYLFFFEKKKKKRKKKVYIRLCDNFPFKESSPAVQSTLNRKTMIKARSYAPL